MTSSQLLQGQEHTLGSVLCLAQALASAGLALPSGLWLLTRGCQSISRDVHRLAAPQATVWGFGKILALEHPELRVARLDLDAAVTTGDAEESLAAAILLQPSDEAQVALRSGTAYVPRLVRKPRAEATRPVHLVATQPGRLDSLEWQPTTRRIAGLGEIEIRVEATGLNFRDVLSVLGMYPGDAGPLGGEVAGVVVAVGPEVRGLAVGDQVAALALGAFDDYVVTAAELTIKQPAGWTFAEMATVPAAFATAYHALVQLANIRRGQRVLIHTAAGGVGLAAVQLAQGAGCEIIATAGSPEKRDYLRSIGVAHVFDSRSPAFAKDVRALLGDSTAGVAQGTGIDVIVNTLSGELIEASFSLLSTTGCFVELGKRGIWDRARVASVRPKATYHIVDLAARSQQAPAEFRAIFAAASAAIAAGTFRPLPVQIYSRDEVQAAFRCMAQAKHIGKLVVAAAANCEHVALDQFRADSHASYLITGGLAGLGLRSAEWLATRGAKHLALMARSQPTAEAHEVLARLDRAGVQVLVCAGDVADAADLARVMQEIRAKLPPLLGVIHSAGVLDDGVVLQQQWTRFERVLMPKLAGAWNLHQATRDMPLNLFVCYSSASAILGSRGQANHVAANAFMDALAHHRRGLGLPALSINWGAWSSIGAAVRRDIFDRVAEIGVTAIEPEQGIAALEQLIVRDRVQATVTPMNWPRFLAIDRPSAERRFFSELGSGQITRPAARATDKPATLACQLKTAHPAERRKLIQANIRDAVVGVLGLDAEIKLDPWRACRDLGFDSVMSIEL
ncbi:MAG TPA: SDR family NAD(P)-dependent oxidoreductase, partial [Pirellulales bacterium]|nr:SDR family NAD(P)-dependent oxidoreductase [Pirellulales bacterium]